jgi:hypothetical protein
MVVLALEAMPLGRLVDARLIAAFPGAVGYVALRLRLRMPRLNANAVEKLGIDTHQS